MRRLLALLAYGATALLTSACTPFAGSPVRDLAPPTLLAGEALPSPETRPNSEGYSATADASPPVRAQEPPLSPGDRLAVDIEDGEGFSGRYEVGIDGALRLPHLSPIEVAGTGTAEAAERIADALVAAGLFKAHRVRVSVLVHEWSHVQVHVSGAVFAPGMVSVNVRSAEERALKAQLAAGDFPSERLLPAALRAAGGVRPDADVGAIRLLRGERTLTVSFERLLQGGGVPAVPLVSGDRIVVPASGRYRAALVAPSAITPPGIRVFLSNLTVPATGNAASAVGRDATSLPYGSRLLTAAVSANCVGGNQGTSAARHAVLVRHNPLTGREEALERPINELLAAPHRDDVNPHVMPNDSVACYDSGVTNLRDIARAIADVLAPFALF